MRKKQPEGGRSSTGWIFHNNQAKSRPGEPGRLGFGQDFLFLRFLNVLADQLLDIGRFAACLLKTGDDVGIRAVVQLNAQVAGVFGIPSSFCLGIRY